MHEGQESYLQALLSANVMWFSSGTVCSMKGFNVIELYVSNSIEVTWDQYLFNLLVNYKQAWNYTRGKVAMIHHDPSILVKFLSL